MSCPLFSDSMGRRISQSFLQQNWGPLSNLFPAGGIPLHEALGWGEPLMSYDWCFCDFCDVFLKWWYQISSIEFIHTGYPLVNWHNYGKSPFITGKSSINDPFSIATLNYQRVLFSIFQSWSVFLLDFAWFPMQSPFRMLVPRCARPLLRARRHFPIRSATWNNDSYKQWLKRFCPVDDLFGDCPTQYSTQ